MDSLDALVAVSLFFLLFFAFQGILSSYSLGKSTSGNPSGRVVNMYDPFFLCSAGSEGDWQEVEGVPGLGLAYNRCKLQQSKLDKLYNSLSNNNSATKDLLGISGKNISIVVSDYFNSSIVYFNYTEPINGSLERHVLPSTYNGSLVNLIVEVEG
ncbi:MAG: hypothetical protein D6769_02260 [Methanobacteriota archaeon]|nr:MAG: hypothetical protein D6769_02260 [Euryarchaeota archaeon]